MKKLLIAFEFQLVFNSLLFAQNCFEAAKEIANSTFALYSNSLRSYVCPPR